MGSQSATRTWCTHWNTGRSGSPTIRSGSPVRRSRTWSSECRASPTQCFRPIPICPRRSRYKPGAINYGSTMRTIRGSITLSKHYDPTPIPALKPAHPARHTQAPSTPRVHRCSAAEPARERKLLHFCCYRARLPPFMDRQTAAAERSSHPGTNVMWAVRCRDQRFSNGPSSRLRSSGSRPKCSRSSVIACSSRINARPSSST